MDDSRKGIKNYSGADPGIPSSSLSSLHPVVIGVLLFTFIHLFYFGWGGVLFILLWSPLSVGLFLWRKSLYPCLVLHILNNLVAYVLIPAILHH